MNDWYDREIDAINEPYRPIPSGAISESEVGVWLILLQVDYYGLHFYFIDLFIFKNLQVITQIWVLLLGGIGLAGLLDVWVSGLNNECLLF